MKNRFKFIRNNFRDFYANKPKVIARKVYATEHSVKENKNYYDYSLQKQKDSCVCLTTNIEMDLQKILKKHI